MLWCLCARRLEILEGLKNEISQNHALEIAELYVSEFESVIGVFLNLTKDLDDQRS